MLIAISVGALLAIMSMILGRVLRKSSTTDRVGKIGIVAIEALNNILVLDQPAVGEAVVIHVFRQSGNSERSFVCASKEEALSEVRELFNRMQEPTVRIWTNRATSCDIRRPYGSFRGRSEGKKIWGCKLEFAPVR